MNDERVDQRDWMQSSGIIQHLTLHTDDGEILVTSP
jgi:hypothetical protein